MSKLAQKRIEMVEYEKFFVITVDDEVNKKIIIFEHFQTQDLGRLWHFLHIEVVQTLLYQRVARLQTD